MNGRIIAGGVLVLVIVIGTIMLIVGSQEGGDVDRGRRDTAPVPGQGTSVAAPRAVAG